ncbi:hypothetical protein M422DRAFT_51813 [Sphaerobolus stellatus SS14]|uniref:F-box domain-containing protein n=1 Tax=Sphaerobolus stellatus (strain SS14) TaxID=990650 RepID=A0A0C9UJ34_SPHS4|nr:hypothetical protein M422DRAFT_51813 [Sphaerobolus stellatus SS14]
MPLLSQILSFISKQREVVQNRLVAGHAKCIPERTTSSLLAMLLHELVEKVIDNIDRPSDLLRLALSSRALHALIVPKHIEFRDIRCHLCHEDIWKLLISNPALAANVRTLQVEIRYLIEVLYPRSFIPELGSTIHYGGEYNLPRALSLMRSLIRLQLTGYASNVPNDLEDTLISNTLLKISTSQFKLAELSLEIGQSLDMSEHHSSLPLFPMPTVHLPTVTTLHIRVCLCPRCHLPGNNFYKFLVTQPDLPLKELSLSVFGSFAYNPLPHDLESGILALFKLATWPNIKRLALIFDRRASAQIFEQGGYCSEILQDFLKRHRGLEALKLKWLGAPILTPDMLPALRSLSFDWWPQSVYHWREWRIPDNLGHQLWHFTVGKCDDDRMLELLKDMPNLKSCRLERTNDFEKFVQLMPNLEYLDCSIAQSCLLPTTSVSNSSQGKFIQLQKLLLSKIMELAKLQRLTHLASFFPPTWLFNNLNTELKLLKITTNLIPTLKYGELFDSGGSSFWVMIQRDFRGMYRGHIKHKSSVDTSVNNYSTQTSVSAAERLIYYYSNVDIQLLRQTPDLSI